MRLKIVCILLGAAMGWSAAGHAVPQPEPKPVETGAIDTDLAKANWRWVGLRSKASSGCPEVPGWRAEDWLARALSRVEPSCREANGQDVRGKALSERAVRQMAKDLALLRRLELDRLCVYSPIDPTAKPLPAIPSSAPAGLVKAEPARMALAPAGPVPPIGQIGERTWKTFADHFLVQTGRVPIPLDARPGVRLVFLDSQPDGEGVPSEPGASFHGYTLAHLARRLVCTDTGNCAADIATGLALPHADYHPDRPPVAEPGSSQGGNLGTLDELAEAIVAAVWQWRRSESSQHQHLILNLSLGWDGELFGDLDVRKVSQLNPSVKAVYDALHFARKSGVLVIAAAGNRRGGPDKSAWPLLPAAWELRNLSDSPPFAIGHKLVYAVGGIDWQGLPLPNSRDGGRPRRAAFGDHAVTGIGANGEETPTAIYTGTSVAAAVISAIAAVVWDLRPELRPDEVMRLIGRSGEKLPSRADFYPWKEVLPFPALAPRTRRLSLCAAVVEACRPGIAECPGTLLNCELGSEPAQLGQCFPRVPGEADPYRMSVLRQASPPPSFMPPCDPSTQLMTNDGAVPGAPCPTDQFGNIASQRWNVPQPPDDPCPGCSLVPRTMAAAPVDEEAAETTAPLYMLELQINPTWLGKLESGTLDIDRFVEGSFHSRMTYTIPQMALRSSAPFRMTDLGDGQSLRGCTARLNFVMRDGPTISIENPVYVDP